MTPTPDPVRLSPAEFQRLLATLLGGRRRIEFIANPGNAGDALINAGAWQVFERLGLDSRIVRPDPARRGDAVLYPGGGNLIPRYQNARRAIEARMAAPFDVFVLLPHTIRGHEDLLQRLDARFHVFCRDLETYAHVRSHAPAARAYLADDLALLLDPDWLLSPRRRLARFARLLPRPSRARAYGQWRWRLRPIRPVDGTLQILRVDVESAGHAGADPRLDLSACYGSYFDAPGEAELVAGDFLRVLQAADRVVTDRLHVGIGASLLDKEVVLLDNDYGKNRALYELSMRTRFPRTRFGEHRPAAAASPLSVVHG